MKLDKKVFEVESFLKRRIKLLEETNSLLVLKAATLKGLNREINQYVEKLEKKLNIKDQKEGIKNVA